MSNFKAVIVDDEKGARESLDKLLKKHCPDVAVKAKAGSADEAIKVIQQHSPELVFLDIEMPGKNAFDLLHEMGSINFDIIFTTAYDQYAIKAIRFSAIDYLLKPINSEELMKAVERFKNKRSDEGMMNEKFKVLMNNLRQEDQPKRVAIPDGEGLTFVKVDSIIRCHSDGSYTTLYFDNGKKIVASKPIGEYEELLSGEKFFRIHRSHLINLDHIKKYMKGDGGYVVMRDGSQVEISRRKKNDFIALLTQS